jgi:hypothetical protein
MRWRFAEPVVSLHTLNRPHHASSLRRLRSQSRQAAPQRSLVITPMAPFTETS